MFKVKRPWMVAGLLLTALIIYVTGQHLLFDPHTIAAASCQAQAVPSPALQSQMQELAALRSALHAAHNPEECQQAKDAMHAWFVQHPGGPQLTEGN